MSRDLHPTLSSGPLIKPICIGCRATEGEAVLTQVRGNRFVFLCITCAGLTWVDANVELARRTALALTDALAPEVVR